MISNSFIPYQLLQASLPLEPAVTNIGVGFKNLNPLTVIKP